MRGRSPREEKMGLFEHVSTIFRPNWTIYPPLASFQSDEAKPAQLSGHIRHRLQILKRWQKTAIFLLLLPIAAAYCAHSVRLATQPPVQDPLPGSRMSSKQLRGAEQRAPREEKNKKVCENRTINFVMYSTHILKYSNIHSKRSAAAVRKHFSFEGLLFHKATRRGGGRRLAPALPSHFPSSGDSHPPWETRLV